MSAYRTVPGSLEIREPVIVGDEESKYSLHEFPRSIWLTNDSATCRRQ